MVMDYQQSLCNSLKDLLLSRRVAMVLFNSQKPSSRNRKTSEAYSDDENVLYETLNDC